mmetsp:Transcript_40868/g.161901  ORF Transcript_40868/g.161901 Transcript_40868/m.161901 type:complete len:115 (+) Transcript_40868:2086-2430(+)
MAEDRTVRNLTCACMDVLVLLDEFALETLECGLIDYVYEVLRQSGELKDALDSDCLSWLLNILNSLASAAKSATTCTTFSISFGESRNHSTIRLKPTQSTTIECSSETLRRDSK